MPEELILDRPQDRQLSGRAQSPTEDQILRQLGTIVGSRRFAASPVLRRIMIFLVEGHLRGDKNIDATSIGKQALGKDAGFTSSQDASVRVAMNRLRTSLQLYYLYEGASDDVIIAFEPGNNSPLISYRVSPEAWNFIDNALMLSESYQDVLTPSANALVLRTLKKGLQSNPDDPRLLAAYCDTCIDAHKFNFGSLKRPLDEAAWAIERAQSIGPELPAVLFQLGMLALLNDDLGKAATLGNKLLQEYPDDPSIALRATFIVRQATSPVDLDRTPCITIQQEAKIPGWVNFHLFLDLYQQQDYESALDAAINMGLESFFWFPLMRAAVLAQLGLRHSAENQLARGLMLNPAFARNPRGILHYHIKHADALEHVLEGLKRAGLS